MKRLFTKFEKLGFYVLSLIFRTCLPIHKGRVLLWATEGKDYGCNPMYISKYIIENEEQFEVWWMFIQGTDTSNLSNYENIVWFKSLKYLYILNTAEFLITNHRTRPINLFWKKRKGQKYIMTWHGTMALKKVENDAAATLGKSYVSMAKYDSHICDLMLSDSEWFTSLLRKSFWYEGEILETVIPRNKKLYEVDNYDIIRSKVLSFFGVNNDTNPYIVLYAPTFRSGFGVDAYITEWMDIKNTIQCKYGRNVIVLVRLHPNLLRRVDTGQLIKYPFVLNASVYNDMQELLITSDMMITDYSSTMFEFSLMNRPCLLYIPDINTYDRGLYFEMDDLPYKKAKTIEELAFQIKAYDQNIQSEIKVFIKKTFNPIINHNGCKDVVMWMKGNRI